jgi:NAD kinase
MAEKGNSIAPSHRAPERKTALNAGRIEIHPGDYVTISASRYPFANVLPMGRRSEDWVNSISRTLQWNSRQRPKSFTN